jgi:DNA-binding winged helix-turn-helix (wHTH) protein
MHKHSRQIYSFDDFTLDLDRGCLLRSGQEVRLRPKSFEVFKYLVEHQGRLVSKSDLMRAVWADAFVTDDSLVQCLIEVRRALGDESRRYVKTVPRRGYIFEAKMCESGAETSNQVPVAPRRDTSFDPSQRPTGRMGRKFVAIVMIWNRNSR